MKGLNIETSGKHISKRQQSSPWCKVTSTSRKVIFKKTKKKKMEFFSYLRTPLLPSWVLHTRKHETSGKNTEI